METNLVRYLKLKMNDWLVRELLISDTSNFTKLCQVKP